MRISLDHLYGAALARRGLTDAAFDKRIDRSLHPRWHTMMHDKVRALGIGKGARILDVGCRDASHALEIARRYRCHVQGIDPVTHNLRKANRLIHRHRLASRVEVTKGRIESIPFPSGHFDLVWCRDVLSHVRNLKAGLQECARVLKPGGRMLLYVVFMTDRMEPRELARLCAATANARRSLSERHFRRCLRGTTLSVVERDAFGSEWREWSEEHGSKHTSRQLLRIARILRNRKNLDRALGPALVEAELGDCTWGVYLMLGKLLGVLYVLRKTGRKLTFSAFRRTATPKAIARIHRIAVKKGLDRITDEEIRQEISAYRRR